MTRKENDKAGGSDSRMDRSHRGTEARFTKEARAKTGQDGNIRGDKMGRDFKDNTGGKGHPDKGPAL